MTERGLKGMTKAIVAEHFGGGPSVLTYYFKTKEDIAAACFIRSIKLYSDIIDSASRHGDLSDRVRHLVDSCAEIYRDTSTGSLNNIVRFDDMRALRDQKVFDAYIQMFRKLHAILRSGHPGHLHRSVTIARTHFLLQQLVSMPAWLSKYHPDDYTRAAARMTDILLYGLQARPTAWPPPSLPLDVLEDLSPAEPFLQAATRLINEHGYFGASIDKISAELDVTKGAFYYHLDRKDALVEACFTRTINVIRRAQRAADDLKANGCERLLAAVNWLVFRQFDGGSPLLRPALSSLPEPLKSDILQEYDRNAVHFGSMVSDGIADGSLRPVDAQIGAHVIAAVINGSTELDQWIFGEGEAVGNQSYVLALVSGLTGPLLPH